MIKLIVNGDDFGITKGVNRGILETAKKGILTSTSVMVNRPYAAKVKEFHQTVPQVGIGLHVEFAKGFLDRTKNQGEVGQSEILQTIEEQITKFKDMAGFMPDHMDFHKVAIRPTKTFVIDDISLFKNPVNAVSEKYNLPWRGIDEITVIDTFHGAIYDSQSHKKSSMNLERISPAALIKVLRSLKDGTYELMTHPGYVDEELTSSYAQEREVEVATLCDPKVIEEIKRLDIKLVPYE